MDGWKTSKVSNWRLMEGKRITNFILLTLHASRPHRRCVPAPRVCAHDGEGLLQQVVLEEDVIRVADVSCVGVEVVGGDAVPGGFQSE